MRNEYLWANEDYELVLKNGRIISYPGQSCYTGLRDYDEIGEEKIDKIIIKNTVCKKTKEYRSFYFQYIIDMLKLDGSFDDTSFTFIAFECNIKNMLVCSLVRLSYEKIGYISPAVDTAEYLLKPLMKGKSKYRNKLKRFCDFYSRIPDKYNKRWHTGHSWQPSRTKIKTTKDFTSIDDLNSVNGFFTNE